VPTFCINDPCMCTQTWYITHVCAVQTQAGIGAVPTVFTKPGLNKGAPGEEGQKLTFECTCTSGQELFVGDIVCLVDEQNQLGKISVAVADGKYGFATFRVVLRDSGLTSVGGCDLGGRDCGVSDEQVFRVVVNQVNSPPKYTLRRPLIVFEESSPLLYYRGLVTNLTVGTPEEEPRQTYQFVISSVSRIAGLGAVPGPGGSRVFTFLNLFENGTLAVRYACVCV
jgi:hypothetical protein